MNRAYLTPYGVGLGHASRMVMLANHLRNNGVGVRFSSFGEAANYVSINGYECVNVPPVEFSWSLEGGFSVKNSIANIPMWFTNFTRQINHEIRNIASFRPDVIISDSRLSPLVTAKLLDIPSIVILNQIKLLLSPRLRKIALARLFEKMTGEFLGVMWSSADRILIPDLPPPYTISEHNIWDIGSVSKRLEYIGFTSPKLYVNQAEIEKVAKSLRFDRSKPIVFFHISGPMQTRLPLIKIALESCRALRPDIQFVISEGRADGSPEPRRIGDSGWYYEWCPVRDEIFAMSNLIVLRGGHVALSQAIQFGKPVITIPIENHGEQLGNSKKISEMGTGLMLTPKGLKPKELTEAVHAILSEDLYLKKAMEIMNLSEKNDGISNAYAIVKSYM